MAAVDDLTELVEDAATAERATLSAKWKERGDVEKITRRVGKAITRQQEELGRAMATVARSPSGRWAELGRTYLELGAPPAGAALSGGPVEEESMPDGQSPDAKPAPAAPAGPADPAADAAPPMVTHEQAATAERNAAAAVALARMALTEAQFAVLLARLARIDAGDTDEDAASIDGHVPLHGRNPVSRHGPALAHGVRGEIEYMLTRKPRAIVKSLAITLALGLLYLGFIRVFQWDRDQKWMPYLGLFALSVVMGGSVCINAMSFDAMRVRAALDSGARLWHLLVIKNLALVVVVLPIGVLLSVLLAWRAGDWAALWKACALLLVFILLWLGVGNVLSIVLPIRDEPIKKRKQSGSLKQFIIAFAVSYAIGYLVNGMLVWRIFAARAMAERLGEWVVPALFLVVGGIATWLMLTIVAVALSQQPKVRRSLQREIADYGTNAEARAYAAEAAAAEEKERKAADQPAGAGV